MNEEMATELVGNLYDTISKFEVLNETDISENAKRYVAILRMQMELDKQKELIYLELDDYEKEEANNVLKKETTLDIPEFLPVRDVAQILDVTPQMVRRYCANGQIDARQRMEGSGTWFIPTEQFINHPNWTKFIQKQERQKRQSLNIADKMLRYLEEDGD